jgi:hypothetical protein
MEEEIKEAFSYLDGHPGGLTIGERELIKGFKRYFKERGNLSEMQERTLLEIRKYRQRNEEKHLY